MKGIDALIEFESRYGTERTLGQAILFKQKIMEKEERRFRKYQENKQKRMIRFALRRFAEVTL